MKHKIPYSNSMPIEDVIRYTLSGLLEFHNEVDVHTVIMKAYYHGFEDGKHASEEARWAQR